MALIGRINTLTVTRVRDYGAHLDGGESGDILLPGRYVPKNCRPGDRIEVFVFAEGENRLRATTRKPHAEAGQFARLKVVANTTAGSFLDWGMPKDLLVPKKEQHEKLEKGKSYVVYVYLDEKNSRISASAKLEKFLGLQPPEYREGEEVNLLVYDKTELGYKAVVNNTHGGLIYKNEVFQQLHPGQQLQGYVKKVRADKKIDLRLQPPGYKKIDAVSRSILKKIRDHGGRIAVTDNTPPEAIYNQFGVSKKTFKKAIGALYKKRLVALDSSGITLIRQGSRSSGTKPAG